MAEIPECRVRVRTRDGWRNLLRGEVRDVWEREMGLCAQTPEELERTLAKELDASSRRLTLELLSAELNRASGSRVLEVGCGWGRIALGMKELHPNLEFTGVDLTPGLLRLGREFAERFDVREPYLLEEGDADKLPYADEIFDFTYGVRVLQYMADPVVTLREWARVVRVDGRVAAILPNTLNPARRDYRTPLYPPTVTRCWFGEAGLVDVRTRFFGFLPKVRYGRLGAVDRVFECLRGLPVVGRLGALVMISGCKPGG